MQGFGRSGGCGNHGNRGGPRAAQILVRQVQQFLIVRVGMNRGHRAVDDAKAILHNLCNRGQAIGRTGGIGDNVVFGGVIGLLIDAKHQRMVRIGGRRGDDHLPDRSSDVLARLRPGSEQPRGLHNDLRAHRSPIELRRVLDLEYAEALSVHRDAVVGVLDAIRQIAEDRIVLQQVS